jgi:hypothetical protein
LVVAVFVVFQAIPISPGSIVRGLYVVYVVIRERNIRDYNIAVCLGFFKYIGYLAFPIQMAYRYPTLARFMAGHWATGAVEVVPVFGERGALLEHAVFGLFYNYPLTVRRRMAQRAAYRRTLRPRLWHAAVVVGAAAGIFAAIGCAVGAFGGAGPMPDGETVVARLESSLQSLKSVWPAAVIVPLLAGAAVTAGGGGLTLSRRTILATCSGIALGAAYALLHVLAGDAAAGDGGGEPLLLLVPRFAGRLVAAAVWPTFVFAIGATLGALATEILLPEVQPARVATRPVASAWTAVRD